MSKHNGINATRDVLKDQLALAASEIERLRANELAAIAAMTSAQDCLATQLNSPWRHLTHCLRRWFA